MPSGGARPGAGRPKGDPALTKVPACHKLPAWLLAWLREQDRPAGVLIEEALVQVHRLKPPGGY